MKISTPRLWIVATLVACSLVYSQEVSRQPTTNWLYGGILKEPAILCSNRSTNETSRSCGKSGDIVRMAKAGAASRPNRLS